jgi:hypothetical protein
MKKYKFLFKPLFFIFNLVFATCLVLFIEKIKPSDFGRHRSWFESSPPVHNTPVYDKGYLKRMCIEYKKGLIDSTQLEKRLDSFFANPKIPSSIQSPH